MLGQRLAPEASLFPKGASEIEQLKAVTGHTSDPSGSRTGHVFLFMSAPPLRLILTSTICELLTILLRVNDAGIGRH